MILARWSRCSTDQNRITIKCKTYGAIGRVATCHHRRGRYRGFLFPFRCADGPGSLASFLHVSGTEVHDAFSAEALAAAVRLMGKYADVPMDFPDATLVWIAELSGADTILTFDRRGFSSFRFAKNRRFKLALDV